MSAPRGGPLTLARAEPAGPVAAERLIAAVRRFHGESGRDVDRRQVDAIAALCGDSRLGLAWLLVAGGKDCGYALAYRRHSIDHGGKVAVLDDLWVEPAQRGRGLGGFLLREVCRDLREAGFSAVVLEADPADPRAAAFYARVGFKPKMTANLELRLGDHKASQR
ncbi:MAG TPA: GNAT family N-acetyltransferase [Propylenella sp.]